jgi:S1-C subfamily serine protease
LIEIEVHSSESRLRSPQSRGLRFPAPGETVYVHVDGSADAAAVPKPNTALRADLRPRAQGGWEAAGSPWFEPVAAPAEASDSVDEPTATSDLGMTTEPARASGRFVLRVTSVERGGPASDAGLEIGDLIVGAGGKPLASADQLSQLAAQAKPIPLVVVDVNTGRQAQVELRPARASVDVAADSPAKPSIDGKTEPSTTNNTPPQRRSLGIAAEPVAIGQRTALKVTRVEPDSPAAKAGLEVGDVLVKANDAALTGVEQLAAALRKSGPKLTLTVRDVRTGREVPVEIELGGAIAVPPTDAATPSTSTAAKGSLGVVTELTFYDSEAAVRITEVEPRSPAARAGLQAGTIIQAANGKAVLHPNDLLDAERNSGGRLKLSTVDARTGKKSTIDVDLAGR